MDLVNLPQKKSMPKQYAGVPTQTISKYAYQKRRLCKALFGLIIGTRIDPFKMPPSIGGFPSMASIFGWVRLIEIDKWCQSWCLWHTVCLRDQNIFLEIEGSRYMYFLFWHRSLRLPWLFREDRVAQKDSVTNVWWTSTTKESLTNIFLCSIMLTVFSSTEWPRYWKV